MFKWLYQKIRRTRVWRYLNSLGYKLETFLDSLSLRKKKLGPSSARTGTQKTVGVPQGSHQKRQVKKVSFAQQGPTWNPQGFPDFPDPEAIDDPKAQDVLKKLQRKAVDELFSKLGLDWVPGEYLALLKEIPDPVNAFRKFCENFGLNFGNIQRGIIVERNLLEQIVGFLLELGELQSIPEANRQTMLQELRVRDFAQAEIHLDSARGVLELLAWAESLGLKDPQKNRRMIFQSYWNFIRIIKDQFDAGDILIPPEDLKQSRELHRFFVDRLEYLEQLMGEIKPRFDWLRENWPNKNDWGKKNASVLDGMIKTTEDLVIALGSEEDLDNIDQTLGKLEILLQDLDNFVKEIQKKFFGGAWTDPEPEGETAYNEWVWAAVKVFGFKETDEPDADMLKKTYRKLAMKNHPDHLNKKSQDEINRRWHAFKGENDSLLGNEPTGDDVFKLIGKALTILGAGKPAKPKQK